MKKIFPTRKNIRLKYYNYSNIGIYFITICIKNRMNLLSKINDENIIILTKEGKIIEENINSIERIYSNVIVDEYVVMPNHVHLILIIKKDGKATIPQIIKQYKMSVSKNIGKKYGKNHFMNILFVMRMNIFK